MQPMTQIKWTLFNRLNFRILPRRKSFTWPVRVKDSSSNRGSQRSVRGMIDDFGDGAHWGIWSMNIARAKKADPAIEHANTAVQTGRSAHSDSVSFTERYTWGPSAEDSPKAKVV